MSRVSRTFIAILGVLLLVPSLAFARISESSTGLSAAGSAAGLSNFCSGSASTCIATFVGRAINIALTFVGIVLVCYFLYGGFLWMTSGGDGKQAGEAKQVFLNAVIGTFIIAISFAVSNFVLTQLGSVVTGTGGTVATTDDPSATTDGAGGTAPSCCYATGDDCAAACAASPSAFGIVGTPSPTACGNICADARHPRVCMSMPSGTPTCAGTGAGGVGGDIGTPADACMRYRTGTPVPSAIRRTTEPCALADCPSGVTDLPSLAALWGRSMSTIDRATCQACVTTWITDHQTQFPGLNGTCVPALTGIWRNECNSVCGVSSPM